MEFKNCTISVEPRVSKSNNAYDVLKITLSTGYSFDCIQFEAVEKLKAYKSIADSLGLKLK